MSLLDTQTLTHTRTLDYIHTLMPLITVKRPINPVHSSIYIQSHTLTYDYTLMDCAVYTELWKHTYAHGLFPCGTHTSWNAHGVGRTD